MDSRATLRMGIGFYIEIIFWPLLTLYGIHVLLANQIILIVAQVLLRRKGDLRTLRQCFRIEMACPDSGTVWLELWQRVALWAALVHGLSAEALFQGYRSGTAEKHASQ